MPKFIFTVLFVTIVSWAAWVFVVLEVSPTSTKSFIAFFTSFFVALTGSVAIVLFTFEKGTRNTTNIKEIFRNCLRKGGMFSGFFVGSGVMRLEGILNWVNVLLFALLLILIEAYFMAKNNVDMEVGKLVVKEGDDE